LQPKAVVAERGAGLKTGTGVLNQDWVEVLGKKSLVRCRALRRLGTERRVGGVGRFRQQV
jgi:hypothetical protein